MKPFSWPRPMAWPRSRLIAARRDREGERNRHHPGDLPVRQRRSSRRRLRLPGSGKGGAALAKAPAAFSMEAQDYILHRPRPCAVDDRPPDERRRGLMPTSPLLQQADERVRSNGLPRGRVGCSRAWRRLGRQHAVGGRPLRRGLIPLGHSPGPAIRGSISAACGCRWPFSTARNMPRRHVLEGWQRQGRSGGNLVP